MRLLEDILILDFSQFLSGPSASLRLADMGARVIKIEKPSIGDICRHLYVSDTKIEGESTIFHAINRTFAHHMSFVRSSFNHASVVSSFNRSAIIDFISSRLLYHSDRSV